MNYRIGIGYDIHRLVEGRKLFLGGIEVPYDKGLLGHSDGDVLLHAIIDALLGASGNPDIGELFPDTDPKYQGVAGEELLKAAKVKIKDKGFKINNIDAVIITEEPKISPFKNKMIRSIAKILELEETRVNIKAKTNEGLGEVGRKEAMASYAVVIISK